MDKRKFVKRKMLKFILWYLKRYHKSYIKAITDGGYENEIQFYQFEWTAQLEKEL